MYYTGYVFVCQRFCEIFLIYFGRACRNRTHTACFEDKNDIHFTKARIVTGPANRNRTHIQEVEALCIIHYTMAGYLVPGMRFELTTRCFSFFLLREVRLPISPPGHRCRASTYSHLALKSACPRLLHRRSVTGLKSYAAAFCFDTCNNVFKQDRCKVGLFYTNAMITHIVFIAV